jgi:hypothetical protein
MAEAPQEDVLLLVAIKTDQPNIKRRLEMILAAAHPVQDPPDTTAQVYAKSVGELTANDWQALARWFGPAGVRDLNIGDVVDLHSEAAPH